MNRVLRVLAGIGVVALLALSFVAGRCSAPVANRQVDTLIIHDTLTEFYPVPTYREPIGKEIVVLPSVVSPIVFPECQDTVRVQTEVEVPMERVVYEDEEYRAVVEGFQPRLAEISVYPKTMIVTKEVRVEPPLFEFHFGPSVSWGWTPHGADLCVGVGAIFTINF